MFEPKQDVMNVQVGDLVEYMWDGLVCRGKVARILGDIIELEAGISGGTIELEKGSQDAVSRYITKFDIITCLSKETENIRDAVNHPKHYTFGTYEVINVIEDWNLGFHEGNCIKYIARAKHKGNELEDLKKAQWYLNRRVSDIELEIAAKDDNVKE